MVYNPAAKKLYSTIMLICMLVSSLQPTLMVSAHEVVGESQISDSPDIIKSGPDFSEFSAPLAQETEIPTEEATPSQAEATSGATLESTLEPTMEPTLQVEDAEEELVGALGEEGEIIQAMGSESISIDVSHGGIDINGFTADTRLTLTIYQEGDPVWSSVCTTDENGDVHIDIDEYQIIPTEGTTYVVTDEVTTRSVVAVPLTVDGVDFDNDTVWGTATPGTTVFGGGGNDSTSAGVDVVADVNGDWTANLSTISFDLTEDMNPWAQIFDAENDVVRANMLFPTVEANITNNWIKGHQFTLGADVTFTLLDGEEVLWGPDTIPADYYGETDSRSVPVDLVPGLTVLATDGKLTKSVDLANIQIDGVDYDTDHFWGTVAPDQYVAAKAREGDVGGGITQTVQADSSGYWEADFSELLDLNEQSWIWAVLVDPDGNETAAAWNTTPASQISASLEYNWINLWNFQSAEEVSLTVKDGETVLYGPNTFTMDEDGSNWIDGWIHSIDLIPGLTIEAAGSSYTKILTLEQIEIQSVDYAADDVFGVGVAGANLRVWGHDDETDTDTGLDIVVGGDGNWSADFSGILDLKTTEWIGADWEDEDGDIVHSETIRPHIEASAINDWINLIDFEPGEEVSLTIKNGETILFGPSTFTMNESGNYAVGNDATSVDLVPGLTIEASGSSIVKTLVLGSVEIQFVDYEADDVFGIGEAGSEIQVCVYDDNTYTSSCLENISVAGDGSWSADFSGVFDLQTGMWFGVYQKDEDHDSTLGEFQDLPHVEASLEYNWISLRDFRPTEKVSLTIKDGETVLYGPNTFTMNEDGSYWIGSRVQKIDLIPGLTIEAIGKHFTKTLTLEQVEIQSVNYAADDVLGAGVAGTSLRVWGHDDETDTDTGLDIVVGGNGSWSADFSGILDLKTAEWIGADWEDEDGDIIHCETPRPHIEASVINNWINLIDFAPGEEIGLTIKDGETALFGPSTFTVNESGNYVVGSDVTSVDLVPGLTIEAVGSSIVKTLVLSSIEIQSVDYGADDVFGIGEAGSEIQVCVYDDNSYTSDCLGNISVAGDGSWSADFSGVFDIQAGMWFGAYQYDEDRDSTSHCEAFESHIEASVTNNWINLQGFHPAEEVSLTIKDGETVLYGPNSLTMDGNGSLWIDAELTPGLTIEAAGSNITKTLTLTSVAVQFVNYVEDVVAGIGEAGSHVRVCVHDDETDTENCFENIPVSNDGSWSANFWSHFDIQVGMWVGAYQYDEDYDYTLAEFQNPPHIEASAVSEWVGGWDFRPNTELTLEVKQDYTTVFGPQTITSRDDGSFWFEVWRTSFELEPGMTVVVTDGLWTKELFLESISIDEVDEDNDQISGSAPPFASLRVEANLGSDTSRVQINVNADDQGNWSADFSGQLDIRYGTWMGIYLEDEDLDVSVYDMEVRTDGVITAAVLEDYVEFSDFSSTAEIEVEVFDDSDTSIFGPEILYSDEDGFVKLSREWHGLDLIPGMRVTATEDSAGIAKELVLQDGSIDSMDIMADLLYGTAPPDTLVKVSVHNYDQFETLTCQSDVSGNWTADFASMGVDLNEYTWAELGIPDADGDETRISWFVPEIAVITNHDTVETWGFKAYSDVTIRIFAPASEGGAKLYGPETRQTDQNGQARWSYYQHGVSLIPGVQIEVDDGTSFKTLVVEPVTLDVIDLENDLLQGTAAPNTTVHVLVGVNWWEAYKFPVQSDGSGNWTADLGAEGFDITDNMRALIHVIDEDGDKSRWYETWPKDDPEVWASLTHDWVMLTHFTPDAAVELEIKAADEEVLYSSFVGQDGYYWMLPEEHGIDLQPGMVIKATDTMTSETKELVLEPLVVSGTDYEADTVSGTAPPNTTVITSVYWNNWQEKYEITTLSDGSGDWLADFGGEGTDLLPYMVAESTIADGDGDRTSARLTEQPVLDTVRLNYASAEPQTLDPSFASERGDRFLLDQLFAGLVGLDDETADVYLELASDWSVSPDGRVYTFDLRPDIVWSDGTPITASDARFGILRAIENGSDTNFGYLLDPIQNAPAYREGSATASEVGVAVLSATQLQVTLSEPDSSFLWVLATPVGRPLPQFVVETWGEDWTAPEHIACSGAYQMSWYVDYEGFMLIKNPNYYDAGSVQIDEVRWYFEEYIDSWQMYLDGAIDTVYLPTDVDYDRPQEISLVPYQQVEYYGFSLSEPPFDDLLVRKAFIAAANRSGLVDAIRGGLAIDGLTFTPPGVFGAIDGNAENIGIPYEPTQAQQWLAQAGYPGGTGLPAITVWHNENSGHSAVAGYLHDNWVNILGVDVAEQSQAWDEYLAGVENGNYQIWRIGWASDYPEAINFLRGAILQGSSRFGDWDSTAYENLIHQAEAEQDSEARKLLYKQAEEILVQTDAVVLPLFYGAYPLATRLYLERTYSSPERGHIANWRITKKHAEVAAGDPFALISEDGLSFIQSGGGLFDTTVEAVYVPMYGPLPDGKGDIGKGFEFYAYDKASWQLASPQQGQTYQITINYLDEDVEGIVEDSLRFYYWNAQTENWEMKSADSFNMSTNSLTVTVDQSGLWTVFGDSIPTEPVVRGNLDEDTIKGEGFTQGGEVTLKVYNPGTSIPAWQSDSIPVSQFGDFWLAKGNHSLDLRLGSKIVATDQSTGIEKTLILDALSVDEEVDFEAAIVKGTSTPGAEVSVRAERTDGSLTLDVIADPGGNWTAEFGMQAFDLDEETEFTAWVTDKDGDETAAKALSPHAPDLVSIGVQGQDPVTLDPSLATDASSTLYLEQMFIGLLDLDDETSEVRPELAESWTVSPDGTVYTFHLRDDVYWSDGTRVTANDARYGILRTIDPAVGSNYSYVLEEIIQNAKEFREGSATAQEVGVKALNLSTLEITLTHPASYFLSILTMWNTRPLPEGVIEVWGEDWTQPEHIVTSGAYRITRRTDNYILMDKNPNYFDADNVAIERVKFLLVDDADAWNLYLNGDLDTTTVPLGVEPGAELTGELHTSPQMCTYYYGFNTQADVVNDVRVRRALSLAIDRQALIDEVLGGNPEPAHWFSRPGLVAAPKLDSYPDLGVGFDPVEANALLQDYLTDVGMTADQLDIELWFNSDSSHDVIAQAIQDMWTAELGITVDLQSEEWSAYTEMISGAETPQIWRLGWCMDYPDAKNFIQDVFGAGGNVNPTDEYGNPAGGVFWQNPVFESLLNNAAVNQNPATRMELYAQAEQILTQDDAVMIPIYWYTLYRATNPYLDRNYAAGGNDDISTWQIAEEYFLDLVRDPQEGGITFPSPNPNSPGGKYLPGTMVQIEAVPADGYVFDGWSGDLISDANPEIIYMVEDLSIVAHFREVTPPTVVKVDTVAQTPDKQLLDGEVTDKLITSFEVQFSEDVNDPDGNDDPEDVTNPANYALVEFGEDELPGGGDDLPVVIDSVEYHADSKVATLSVNGGQPLPIGLYQLMVSGTSSIEDLAGNKLDGNDDGIGGDDFTLEFTVSIIPSMPVLISPETGAQISDATPELAWDAAQDAVRYQIQLDNSLYFTSPEVDTVVGDGALTYAPEVNLPDGKYYWRVRGLNRFDLAGSWSSKFNFIVDTQPPDPSGLLTPANNSFVRGTPLFTWGVKAGAVLYQFQIDDVTDFSNSPYTSDLLTEQSFEPPQLEAGTYYWRVRSADASGNWLDWEDCDYFTVTVLLLLPGQPALVTPGNNTLVGTDQPSFSWNAAENTTHYHLQIASDSGFKYLEEDVILPGDLSYTDAELPDGKHYWRVRGLNENMEAGPWTATWIVTTDTTAPVVPELIAPAMGTFTNDTTPVLKIASSVGAETYHFGLWDNPDRIGDALVSWQQAGTSLTVPAANALDYGVYYWTASAEDSAGNVSSYHQPWKLTITAQISPEDGSFVTDQNPLLKWSAVAGATGYSLKVSGNEDFSDPLIVEPALAGDVQSYIIPDAQALIPGSYYWQVEVQTAAGWLTMPVWQFTVSPVPPEAPNLAVPVNNELTHDSTPDFSWEPVVDGVQYEIEIDTSTAFNTVGKRDVVLEAGELSYTADPMEDGKYFWRVRALNLYGFAGAWSTTWIITVDTLPPASPALSSPANNGVFRGTPSFAWKAAADGKLYQFQIDDSPEFDNAPFTSPASSERTYALAESLSQGSYYWRVRSADAAGNWGDWADCGVYTFTILPEIPAAPILSSPGTKSFINDNTPDFNWESVENAYQYQIQIDSNKKFTNSDKQDVTLSPGENLYTADLLPDGKYYWRVRALNNNLEMGPWSKSWYFTVDTEVTQVPQLSVPAENAFTPDMTPTFKFKKVSGAQQYRIGLWDNAGLSGDPVWMVQTSRTSATILAGEALNYGEYYWAAEAVDAAGNHSGWSDSRKLMIQYLKGPAPDSFMTDTTPKFTWVGVSGATAYWLEVSVNPDLSSPFISEQDIAGGVRAYNIPDELALVPGDYYWRMKYQKEDVWSDYSLTWKFTITPLAPNPPVLDAPAANYLTAVPDIDFAWQEAELAEGYRIQIDDDARFRSPLADEALTAGVREYSITGLEDGKYYWRVCSRNEYGAEGAWSGSRSFIVDTQSPSAPVLYTPKDLSVTTDTTPSLRVIKVKDARSYRFQVWDNAAFAGDPLADALQSTYYWTIPADEALPYGDYFWRAQAVDAAGNPSAWSEAYQLTVSFLKSPQDETFFTDTTPVLSWASVSGAQAYGLEISTDPDFGDFVIQVEDIPAGTTSYTVSEGDELLPDVYYWRMRVLQESVWGENTPAWSFGVTANIPDAPQLVSPDTGALTPDPTPQLDWAAAAFGVQYRIQIDNDAKFRTPEVDSTLDADVLTFVSPELADGRYYWRVQALNVIGAPGAWSPRWQFVVDTAAPAAPKLSRPTNNSMERGNPTFSWKKTRTAVAYQFQIDDAPDFAAVEYTSEPLLQLSHTMPEVLPPGSYYWRVRASDAAGNWGEWSEHQVVTILLGIPTRPDLLLPAKKSFTNDSTPELSWNSVEFGVVYRVQISNSSRFKTILQDMTLPVDELSCVTEALEDGKYYWHVMAYNANMEQGTWSRASYFTIDTVEPTAPRLSAPTDNAVVRGNPIFTWGSVKGAVNYQIQMDDTLDFSSPVQASTLKVRRYQFSVLPDPGVYYWRVRAQDSAGNWSAWQTYRTVTIMLGISGKPQLISPANQSSLDDETPDLTWDAVPYGTYYEVQVDDSSGFGSPEQEAALAPDTLTYTTDPLPAGKYYWRVRAVNANGEKGTWSAAWYFKIN